MDNFVNIRPIKNWNVLLLNNLRLQATHLGDIHFSNDFALLDVLIVPSVHYNLFYVTKLAASLHCEVVFFCKSFYYTGYCNPRGGLVQLMSAMDCTI